MSNPHDFTASDEAGYYAFTEDTQLEMIQLRDRLAMYADMIAATPSDADESHVPLTASDLQTCFRDLANEMTRLLDAGDWRPND